MKSFFSGSVFFCKKKNRDRWERVLSLLGWFTVQKTSILHELFENQHLVNIGSTGQHFLLAQSVEKPKNKKLVVTMFWVNILCWPVDPLLTKVANMVSPYKIDVFCTRNCPKWIKIRSARPSWIFTKNAIFCIFLIFAKKLKKWHFLWKFSWA